MSDNSPIPYRLARVVVLGECIPPIREGHPIATRICYPIEPKDGLFLLGDGNDPTVEEQRLADLIRETWHRIPEADRHQIVSFWREDGRASPYLEIEWAPQIEVRDEWTTRGARNTASTLGGAVFYFHRRSVREGASERTRTAAAHELAHALQKATGEWGQQRPVPKMTPGEREDFLVEKLGCPKKMLGTVLLALHRTPEQMVEYLHSDDEARTDAILRRWGFDPTVLD